MNLKSNRRSWWQNGDSIALHFFKTWVAMMGVGLLSPVIQAWAADAAREAILPPGVKVAWDINQAWRQATPTRERVCLNGLWRWQPVETNSDIPPTNNWGFFKVPGCWPGVTDYMQKDCQTLYAHPDWQKTKLSQVVTAWQQREIAIPENWAGQRIFLAVECLNSYAAVFVDGQRAGDLRFPGGDLDLTSVCRPGQTHLLSLRVAALPLKSLMLSFGDTFGTKQIPGQVPRRGLCGDVYLGSLPSEGRIENVKISTSVRRQEITFKVVAQGVAAEYQLRATVSDHGQLVKTFESPVFARADWASGKYTFTTPWKPEKLWDLNTPQNLYEASVTLTDGHGKVLDTAWPEKFGFRELWIDGRDFRLNGSRIFLSAVPLDNAQNGAAWATYEAARETLQRLKSFGVNFVYTHNYGCEPGTHLSFSEILRAADDEGVLVSFSQPHFGQYSWKGTGAGLTNGYAQHAAAYVRMAQNHPSVVFYSMSHNGVGSEQEMNPDMIDGLQDVRGQWSSNNVKLAVQAEAIVSQLDHSRIIYHHSSGNLGTMHTANFYANFVPIQEMSDWLEHWATVGVKPLFLCEYGAPLFWDWTMYRGWYQGKREFGSAQVPWELCVAEWDAQYFGARAYQISELEKNVLRWEAQQFRTTQGWHRWDYPRNAIGTSAWEQRNEVLARYLTDNLRAFRTWGLSALCPWDHSALWQLREGVDRKRKNLPVDWEKLQRPGFSPDYIEGPMETINSAFERTDWIPTAAGQALIRNNQPVLGYIAGKPEAFTSKDHLFYAGDRLEKQLILIHNSRQPVGCVCEWNLALDHAVSGRQETQLETGEQSRITLPLTLPPNTKPGRYKLAATFSFAGFEPQTDEFWIDVLPKPEVVKTGAKIALFDPLGETTALLARSEIHGIPVDEKNNLDGFDLLIIGKQALTLENPGPNLSKLRAGLKVIVFEQTAEVLEKRLGFRIAEYGLREVFPAVANHPILSGISNEYLADWRGAATLVPPRLVYEMGKRNAPQVMWCGIPQTRLWRAGNRGNVASVVIEKPAVGDFLPILHGGFGLQYSPLLQCQEGQGLILFCQADVTGRTEQDPAAALLVRNLIQYAVDWRPAIRRQAIYAGDPAGLRALERAGIQAKTYAGGRLPTNAVLVVAPGSQLGGQPAEVRLFLQAGGHIIAFGLEASEANAFLPFKISTTQAEHIAAYFPAPETTSPFAGISPAEVHNRDPHALPLVTAGANLLGNGVLAAAADGSVVFCQYPPQEVLKWAGGADSVSKAKPDEPWPKVTQNARRNFRRASCLLARLLANAGVAASTPLPERIQQPLTSAETPGRWLAGLYLDTPEEWDDPYRFFCW